MILVKIGSDSNCDIVLHSEYVSALHAELLIGNNGEIFLEDKGSRNGTTVGQKRLEPGRRVKISRCEHVMFANAVLNWSAVPTLTQKSNTMMCYEIGKDSAADIKLSSQYASRFHATLKVTKDKKAFIEDNGSKNGTRVNGSKIVKHQMVRLKKGDQVICGDEDVTEAVNQYMPKSSNRALWITACVAALLLLAGLCAYFFGFGKKTNLSDMESAVAFVRPHYHYVAHFEDTSIPEEIWNGDIDMKDVTGELTGEQTTAFFVDTLGRMASSRCVAVPWEYASEAETAAQMAKVTIFWSKFVGAEPIDMTKNKLAEKLLKYAAKAAAVETNSDKVRESLVKSYLRKILASKIILRGVLDDIQVGYSGQNYYDAREFDQCTVLRSGNSKSDDVALLLLKSKSTPASAKTSLSISNIYKGGVAPINEQLYVAGFSKANAWDVAKNVTTLNSRVSEVKCVGSAGENHFALEGDALADAVGSPVFNERGELVAIICGQQGDDANGVSACQVKYLQQLYFSVVKTK